MGKGGGFWMGGVAEPWRLLRVKFSVVVAADGLGAWGCLIGLRDGACVFTSYGVFGLGHFRMLL